MALQLRITFNGHARGLQRHRLSLAAFAKPLERLVVALQRTASGLLSGDPNFGKGRIADEARALDFEIHTVEDNCFTLNLDCVEPTLNPAATSAEREFAERSIAKLLDDIQAEVKNSEDNNPAVRRFVQALPQGLESQAYRFTRDGVVIREFTCGSVPHVEEQEFPRLVQIRGEVIGVWFPTGGMHVGIKTGTRTLRVACEVKHVDKALALRGSTVRAAVMQGDETRLVWIKADDPFRERPTLGRSVTEGLDRWTRTLDILGQ